MVTGKVFHGVGKLGFDIFCFQSQIQGKIYFSYRFIFLKKITFLKFSAHFQTPFTFIIQYILDLTFLPKIH